MCHRGKDLRAPCKPCGGCRPCPLCGTAKDRQSPGQGVLLHQALGELFQAIEKLYTKQSNNSL